MTQRTTVAIPATIHVVYADGRVTRISVTPHAGGAGYFGPAASVFDGDVDLDVDDTGGEFWTAVQSHLNNNGPLIPWEE